MDQSARNVGHVAGLQFKFKCGRALFVAGTVKVLPAQRQPNRRAVGFPSLRANDLQHENDTYSQNINALKNDKSAIEKEARQKLGYVRPGEVVYVTPSAPAATATKPAQGSARK